MPALGLPSLQASLKAAGVEVRLHDLNIALYDRLTEEERAWWDPSHHFVWYAPVETGRVAGVFARLAPFIDDYLRDAVGDGPALVGFTALATQKFPVFHLAGRLKALRPDCRIVVGGASCFPQYSPREIAAHPAVDYVVVGEGEHAVVDLARYVAGGAAGTLPPGILRRRGADDGVIEAGEPRPLERALDEFPFPDFSGLPLDKYRDRGRLPIFTSRGCVNRCVFCIERKIWERFRFRGAAHIVGEIENDMARWGADKLEFNDSLFNGNIRVLEEMCDRMAAAGLEPKWGGEGIIRKEMTPALLAKLRKAGCGYITYGLESASQKVLDLMRKGMLMSHVERVVRDTRAAGICQKINIMVGFPGETEEDFRQTLDFILRNAGFIDEVNPSDGFTGIFPGTELYERKDDFGVVFVNHHYFWETGDGRNTLAVRIDRFERVLRHVAALGLRCTYPGTELLDRDKILGDFHANRGEHAEALRHYAAHAGQLGVPPESVPGFEESSRRHRGG